MLQQLRKLAIEPAKASTREYYLSNKDKSYKVNLDSGKRGKAIIFVMTRNRIGWEQDVRMLYECFISLDIHVELYEDPTTHDIDEHLKHFASDHQNDIIDCCFVAFLGHGYGIQNNVYLSTPNGDYNIWERCHLIFTSNRSNVKNKPKVFLVQVCRTSPNVRPGYQETDEAVVSLSTFKHYKFLFACQPGNLANRNTQSGSCFIEILSNLLGENSHENHLQGIVTKLFHEFERRESDERVQNQMPQTWINMSKDCNLFPGVTRDTLLPYSIEEQSDDSTYRTINYNATALSPLIHELFIEIKTLPDNSSNVIQIKTKVFNCLSKRDTCKTLEKKLSDHLDFDTWCSLNILSDQEKISCQIQLDEDLFPNNATERLQFLSDTNILTNIFETEIKRRNILKQSVLETMKLKVKLIQGEDKCEIFQHLKDKIMTAGEKITIKCPSTCDETKRSVWQKDKETLQLSNRVSVNVDDNHIMLVIENVEEADSGFYKCKYEGTDGNKYITQFDLRVTGKMSNQQSETQPSGKQKTGVSSTAVGPTRHEKTGLRFMPYSRKK